MNGMFQTSMVKSFVLALAVVSLVGCGVKRPPRPLGIPDPPSVTNLAHVVAGGEALLKWTVPSASSRVMNLARGFIVYRSKTAIQNGSCEGCPVLFKRIADVAYDPQGDQSDMSYNDPIEPGYHYVYKVVLFLEGGRLGGDSNFVTFDY